MFFQNMSVVLPAGQPNPINGADFFAPSAESAGICVALETGAE
jgi:hypothetical protein